MKGGEGYPYKFDPIEIETSDDLTLRGVHAKLKNTEGTDEGTSPKRLVVFMHGTKTYLPNKWKFFAKLVPNLKADVIAF